MAKKELQEIISFLNEYDYEDVAIALMAIENNNATQSLNDEKYEIYKNAYKNYFSERDDLTGILNEVLQNAIDHTNIEKRCTLN